MLPTNKSVKLNINSFYKEERDTIFDLADLFSCYRSIRKGEVYLWVYQVSTYVTETTVSVGIPKKHKGLASCPRSLAQLISRVS